MAENIHSNSKNHFTIRGFFRARSSLKNGEFAGDNPTNIDITSKFEIHKIESEDKTKPSSMAEFLDSYSRKSTRRMYRRSLELFCEWYGKDVDTILKERKDDLHRDLTRVLLMQNKGQADMRS